MAQTVKTWNGQAIHTTSQNSGWIDTGDADAGSFHLIVKTNTDTEGTWTVKASNDTTNTEAGVSLPFSADGGSAVTSVALAAGATDEHVFEFLMPGIRFVRLEFARTAGTVGTADLWTNLQGHGA